MQGVLAAYSTEAAQFRHRLLMPRSSRSTPCSRRRFLGGASLGALTLSLPRRAGAREEPLSILLLGDSMIAGGFGLFLGQSLERDHGFAVHRHGKSSTGLARPDFYDWMEQARELVAEHPHDVAIVMFGGNDVQGLYMGRGEDRKREWIRWPEDGWSQEYARRVDEFTDILQPSGQQVFWIGLPIMRPEKFRARCHKVNIIYRAEMAIRPNALFIDTWRVLADENGEYADKIVLDPSAEARKPKKVRVRAGDGIHLSPAGAHYLEAYVLGRLVPVLEKM
jgi:hypothetical protein